MNNKIFIYFNNQHNSISFKNLDKKDKRKVKKSPNLMNNQSFRLSRWLKYKYKKKKIFLAHKKSMSILVNSKKRIGVDIEEIKNRNFESILNFCFTKKEKDFIYKSNDKMMSFYKIFTTKEAIIKYKNLSFSDLKYVSFFDDINKFHIKKDNFLITIVF